MMRIKLPRGSWGTRVKAATTLAVLVAVTSLVASCDPCAGTPTCRTNPEISYSGRVVDHVSGIAVPGTQVQFIRDSGVALVGDTIRAIADADGFFRLSASASASGWVGG